MSKSKLWLGAALLVAMSAGVAYAAEPLRIGVPTDLSGTYATLGDEVMRAVRFAARFEYAIEPETLAAIQWLAVETRVVSRERVREELTKMLTEGRARRAFQLLDETGLLKEILPEVSRMKNVEQPAEFHPEGDVFTHTLLALDYLPHPCPATLAWGTLLHDVGKPSTFRVAPDRIRFDGHVEVGVKIAEEICSRLRFSNHDAEQVLALIDNHMRFGHVSRMKESTLKRFMRLPGFEEHLALHRADSLASHGILTTYEFLREKLVDARKNEIVGRLAKIAARGPHHDRRPSRSLQLRQRIEVSLAAGGQTTRSQRTDRLCRAVRVLKKEDEQ